MVKIGKYEIIRELGHGATSTVYLALDAFNNEQVALKLFNLDALQDYYHGQFGVARASAMTSVVAVLSAQYGEPGYRRSLPLGFMPLTRAM